MIPEEALASSELQPNAGEEPNNDTAVLEQTDKQVTSAW